MNKRKNRKIYLKFMFQSNIKTNKIMCKLQTNNKTKINMKNINIINHTK